jgi:hypothetical protein
MRARLVTPITQTVRQMTMMKYGFFMEKRDMILKAEKNRLV